ncbi:hypothetical protein EDB84DRAFT_579694 [Lactarius hengduanensis]|nr:hypothetical protein EDB84DRAFT_579694 [Lactarius hengduanensis]
MTSPRPLFFRSPCTLSPNTRFLFVSGLQYSFYLPSCTPHLYPHDPPPSLLLIQRIHNIKRTIHTKNAPTRRYSHTLSYCTTQPIPSCFSCPISICALLFPSFPFFFFLSFCIYPISIRSSLPCPLSCSILFLSALAFVIRRLICAHSLSFTLTPFSSLAICFRGIANI